MGDRVEISSALLHRMMMAARDPTGGAATTERCGILLGEGDRIDTLEMSANVAPDPHRAFEIDPAALLGAYRRHRLGAGPAILGWFHTHPTGAAKPSRRDADAADPDGRLWAIAIMGEVRLWRAVPHGEIYGRFNPVRFDIRTGMQLERGCRAAFLRDLVQKGER